MATESIQWRYPLADLDLGEPEQQAVAAVLQSKWLTMGAQTQAFEAEFASAHGAKYAVAVGNCTQALHMALLALGIGPGDEVIVPSLSFVATANAVLYTGATVRFAEVIGLHNPTINPQSVLSLVNKHTRAIIPMHYAGYPCQMQPLADLADRHKLAIIEDVAHAPGASLNGRALGTYGSIGAFSFFSNKNLSTGEGGMLLTDSESLDARLRLLRSHGMTSLTWDRHKGHANSYDVVALGYNNRIDEIRSAIGRVQLAKLAANNQRRLQLTHRYWQAFAGSPVQTPFSDGYSGDPTNHPMVKPAGHILPVLLPKGANRANVMAALRQAGIQTSIHYPPIHSFTAYRQRYGEQSLPITEDYAARELTLPLYPALGEEDVATIAKAVISAIGETKEKEQ